MEVRYITGTDADFVEFIKNERNNKRAEMIVEDGKHRWVVTREDGTKYIARPYSVGVGKQLYDDNLRGWDMKDMPKPDNGTVEVTVSDE